MIAERLKRKFGAAIVTQTPRVPYRETIRGKTQVEGRYKKQTGGRGMFGHVWLEIEPNPGGGVVFAERVVGGSVPEGLLPGRREGRPRGGGRGRPRRLSASSTSRRRCTTARSTRSTRTSCRSRSPASMALKKGVQDCKPVLLEPIMDVEVRVPEAYMGDVNRDLNTRRGRVLGMDTDGDGMQVVSAHVPQAELFTYATELRSLTGGRGTFTAELDHYEEVPSHVAEKIIEQHHKELDAAGH